MDAAQKTVRAGVNTGRNFLRQNLSEDGIQRLLRLARDDAQGQIELRAEFARIVPGEGKRHERLGVDFRLRIVEVAIDLFGGIVKHGRGFFGNLQCERDHGGYGSDKFCRDRGRGGWSGRERSGGRAGAGGWAKADVRRSGVGRARRPAARPGETGSGSTRSRRMDSGGKVCPAPASAHWKRTWIFTTEN